MDSNPATAIAGEAPQPLSHQHRQQDQPILLTEWGEDHEKNINQIAAKK